MHIADRKSEIDMNKTIIIFFLLHWFTKGNKKDRWDSEKPSYIWCPLHTEIETLTLLISEIYVNHVRPWTLLDPFVTQGQTI